MAVTTTQEDGPLKTSLVQGDRYREAWPYGEAARRALGWLQRLWLKTLASFFHILFLLSRDSQAFRRPAPNSGFPDSRKGICCGQAVTLHNTAVLEVEFLPHYPVQPRRQALAAEVPGLRTSRAQGSLSLSLAVRDLALKLQLLFCGPGWIGP